jgi:hypothetical protein
MSSQNEELRSSSPPFSRGGYSGAIHNVLRTQSRFTTKEREELAEERALLAIERANQDVVKLASVRMDGWEKEKEVRVRNAFDRIIQKGWYDKSEHTLKAAELGHINAVREHYAMRRDKIKTPSFLPTKRSNAMTALEWADNVNAVDDLSESTNLRDHFAEMLQRRSRTIKKQL